VRNKLAVALALAVAYLAVSSMVFVPRSVNDGMDITIGVKDGEATMEYSVAGGRYMRNLTSVALEVSRVHQGPVHVLINEGLDFRVKVSLQRMADHFNNELPLYGSSVQATVIGTDGLPDVFSDPQATLVVGPGAYLPDYYSYPALEWVKSGGLWVGIGAGSVPFVRSSTDSGRPNATMSIDFMEAEYDGGAGVSATPMAKALGLRYVAPSSLFRLGDLEAEGGRSIGYEFDRGEPLATAGVIALGNGSLLLVAGDMLPPPLATGEEVLAWDIIRIVLLNVPWWSGNMRFEVLPETRADLSGSMVLPLAGSGYVCCGLISNNDAYGGFKVVCVPAYPA
jgi:hypothetical protein